MCYLVGAVIWDLSDKITGSAMASAVASIATSKLATHIAVNDKAVK